MKFKQILSEKQKQLKREYNHLRYHKMVEDKKIKKAIELLEKNLYIVRKKNKYWR